MNVPLSCSIPLAKELHRGENPLKKTKTRNDVPALLSPTDVCTFHSTYFICDFLYVLTPTQPSINNLV